MNRAIAGNGEVAPKTRFLHHCGAVSADQHRFAGIKRVVVIKNKIMGEAGYRAVVGCHLAKVFADVFEAGELEGANRHRAEIYTAGLSGDLRVIQGDGAPGYRAVIQAANGTEQAAKVLAVERATEALAIKQRIVLQAFRYPPVGEYIGEIQLATGLEHAKDLRKNALLVRGEVDDTVGDDQIKRVVGDAAGSQIFDVSVPEIDICSVEAELPCMGVTVFASDGQLFIGHVNADNESVLADKL